MSETSGLQSIGSTNLKTDETEEGEVYDGSDQDDIASECSSPCMSLKSHSELESSLQACDSNSLNVTKDSVACLEVPEVDEDATEQPTITPINETGQQASGAVIDVKTSTPCEKDLSCPILTDDSKESTDLSNVQVTEVPSTSVETTSNFIKPTLVTVKNFPLCGPVPLSGNPLDGLRDLEKMQIQMQLEDLAANRNFKRSTGSRPPLLSTQPNPVTSAIASSSLCLQNTFAPTPNQVQPICSWQMNTSQNPVSSSRQEVEQMRQMYQMYQQPLSTVCCATAISVSPNTPLAYSSPFIPSPSNHPIPSGQPYFGVQYSTPLQQVNNTSIASNSVPRTTIVPPVALLESPKLVVTEVRSSDVTQVPVLMTSSTPLNNSNDIQSSTYSIAYSAAYHQTVKAISELKDNCPSPNTPEYTALWQRYFNYYMQYYMNASVSSSIQPSTTVTNNEPTTTSSSQAELVSTSTTSPSTTNESQVNLMKHRLCDDDLNDANLNTSKRPSVEMTVPVTAVPSSSITTPSSTIATSSQANEDLNLSKYVWISNLPQGIRAVDIKDKCVPFGKVQSIKIIGSRKLKPPSIFAYLVMENHEVAKRLVQGLKGTKLVHNEIKLKQVQPLHLPSLR